MTPPTTPHPIDEQVERAVEKQLDNVRWLLNGLTVIGDFDPATKDEIRKCILTAIRIAVEPLHKAVQQTQEERYCAEWEKQRVDAVVVLQQGQIAKLRQQLAARDAEIERAVQAEREACAKIADDTVGYWPDLGDLRTLPEVIASRIRARTTPSTEGGR